MAPTSNGPQRLHPSQRHTLRVTGAGAGAVPASSSRPAFRIGNNGDNVPTATGDVIVEKNGYLRLDPAVSRKGSGGWQIYVGGYQGPDRGFVTTAFSRLVQNADGTTIPRFVFSSARPGSDRIVISGKGQLLLAGDPAAIAQIADTDTSLQRPD